MFSFALRAIAGFALHCIATSTFAQQPGKVDMQAAEMVAELIGAPVFTHEGLEVGEVADVAFDEELQPIRLRMKTSSHLGLGSRMVEITRGKFLALRGAVFIDLPVEVLETIPERLERQQHEQ